MSPIMPGEGTIIDFLPQADVARQVNITDRVDRLLRRMTYKPGWTYEVVPRSALGSIGVTIRFSFEAPDSRRPQPQRVSSPPTGVPFPIDPTQSLTPPLRSQTWKGEITIPYVTFEHMTDRQIWEMWREELGRIELHERDEWIRVDGELLHDPHADGWRP